MDDINHTYITGRAASKVRIKKFDDIYRYSFIAAVNYKSQKKQKEYADFIPISYWRRYPCAEIAELKIGDGVFIIGKVITRSYEANNQKNWVTEVQGRDFKRLHSKDLDELMKAVTSDSDLIDKILSIDDSKLSESFKQKLQSSIASEDHESSNKEIDQISIEDNLKVTKK